MEQEVDPNKLCCGGLLEAEYVADRVVLYCLSCGKSWALDGDGRFVPFPPAKQRESAAEADAPQR